MTNSHNPKVPRPSRQARWLAGLLVGLLALAGCDNGAKTGEVTGTVTVDGQTPAVGSSITFIPADGKAQSAGCLIENGKYTAKVPVGASKVEIVYRSPLARKARRKAPAGIASRNRCLPSTTTRPNSPSMSRRGGTRRTGS